MSFRNVVQNGYCIGCGACKLVEKELRFKRVEGIPVVNLDSLERENNNRVDMICPFSDGAASETEIADELFKDVSSYDDNIGRSVGTYAFRLDDKKVTDSSSGGGATWILQQLLLKGEIDKVIHVKESKSSDRLYEFSISESVSSLEEGRKSKYYPVSLNEIIETVANDTGLNYAITAIPCFAKAIRLLQRNGMLTNIKFVVGIFCGHYKSEYFHQFNALQLGVKPNNIRSYDFRVKSENFRSDDYFMSVTDLNNNTKYGRISELFANSWGYGLFKPKACEFCDDISGETCDIVFGDAWLPKYTSDWRGTNVVIIRNRELLNHFESQNDIYFEAISPQDVINSQLGNFRHRRGGVIARNKFVNGWKPRKRIELCQKHYTEDRFDLYKRRWELSEYSQMEFTSAVGSRKYFLFFTKLFIKILKFEHKNGDLFRFVKSEVIRVLRPVVRFLKRRHV